LEEKGGKQIHSSFKKKGIKKVRKRKRKDIEQLAKTNTVKKVGKRLFFWDGGTLV